MTARLPAHLEVSGLIRQAQAVGGFGAVLRKGERDAGTILLILAERGRPARLFERMPSLDGNRGWTCSRQEDPENKSEFSEYIERRGRSDPDLWVIEVEVDDGERLILGD